MSLETILHLMNGIGIYKLNKRFFQSFLLEYSDGRENIWREEDWYMWCRKTYVVQDAVAACNRGAARSSIRFVPWQFKIIVHRFRRQMHLQEKNKIENQWWKTRDKERYSTFMRKWDFFILIAGCGNKISQKISIYRIRGNSISCIQNVLPSYSESSRSFYCFS